MITKSVALFQPPKLSIISKQKNLVKMPMVGEVRPNQLSEVLFITTFPPRECGIATYTQDLIQAINQGFGSTFKINICALDIANEVHSYPDQVKYILQTDEKASYIKLASDINENFNIRMVMLQHEFGLFGDNGVALSEMIQAIHKPVMVVFHTVLPGPNEIIKRHVQDLSEVADSLIVMTQSSSNILIRDYNIKKSKIRVIPHGTHLIKHGDRDILKVKYGLQEKSVLSTFGFLGSGKSIETTLDALPSIIKVRPETMFLIIGKTHPSTIKKEGEFYRDFLEAKVAKMNLKDHVKFINAFLPLGELLEYLQLTDIYLFTSKDPNQAVSGTFAYAISCGCPIISTPIPHAKEVLKNDAGIIIDFLNPQQLSNAVIYLLKDEHYRSELSMNGLHRMASTAWENSAIAHANLIKAVVHDDFKLKYEVPAINLSHIKKMTTDIGILQFSKINIPDKSTGYTLDDNARALVALCQHYTFSGEDEDIKLIRIYTNFIMRCLQEDGNFLNYIDIDLQFTSQNQETNLEDSNGRAIWALGFLISKANLIPQDIVSNAILVLDKALENAKNIHSTRAMSFIIKGLNFANLHDNKTSYTRLINILGQRLLRMYLHESESHWQWYESYLTYGNSIIPEAMLCAFLSTGNKQFKEVAEISFDFLLSKTFNGNQMQVISNQTWMHRDKEVVSFVSGGEQPIDVAYTILALKRFGDVFMNKNYSDKMKHAFNWFLGDNYLQQIIYNPCTGGCYDGLEEHNVNLNQGAESTVSYLMARMAMEGVY